MQHCKDASLFFAGRYDFFLWYYWCSTLSLPLLGLILACLAFRSASLALRLHTRKRICHSVCQSKSMYGAGGFNGKQKLKKNCSTNVQFTPHMWLIFKPAPDQGPQKKFKKDASKMIKLIEYGEEIPEHVLENQAGSVTWFPAGDSKEECDDDSHNSEYLTTEWLFASLGVSVSVSM